MRRAAFEPVANRDGPLDLPKDLKEKPDYQFVVVGYKTTFYKGTKYERERVIYDDSRFIYFPQKEFAPIPSSGSCK